MKESYKNEKKEKDGSLNGKVRMQSNLQSMKREDNLNTAQSREDSKKVVVGDKLSAGNTAVGSANCRGETVVTILNYETVVLCSQIQNWNCKSFKPPCGGCFLFSFY